MPKETVDIFGNKNRIVDEAYRVLRANILFSSSNNRIRTLAVASYNPCEGKTTVAANLAACMAKAGSKTLLADADLKKPEFAKWFGDQGKDGLSDILSGYCALEDAVCKTSIENLHYIPGGTISSYYPNILGTPALEDFLKKASSKYDFIILDTPALSSAIDCALVAEKTDAVLIAVKPGFTEAENLMRIKAQLERANANILGVVMNRVRKKDFKKYFEAYNYFYKMSKKRKKKDIKDPS